MRRSRELRVFHELARVVAAGPYEVEEVLERVCTEVRTAFDFDRALLVRYNPTRDTVHAVVQQNVEWPGDEWLPLDMFPFLRSAMERRTSVLVRDPLAEQALPGSLVERFGVRSIAAVPLAVENRCLGFLVLDRAGSELDLVDEDLELLTALGCVAAVLIEKAEQFTALQHAVEELRRVDEAKSDFISIASHELRTPIAVVHGIASTLFLRGNELTQRQLDDLRSTLHQQTSRLAELASQLLDLSRLEAGALTIDEERIRPRQCVEELLLRIAPESLADVQVEIDPELDVVTDPAALERVLANLVTNALRYGRPPVVIRAEADDEFRLVVEDHGDGVDAAFVPKLFDRFTRSTLSRKDAAGAGLGLSIASSYAEALGGELRYEDVPDAGARFALTLPRAAA